MTRQRIANRRKRRTTKADLDAIGPRVQRIKGVCEECQTFCDLVRGRELCLRCFVRQERRQPRLF